MCHRHQPFPAVVGYLVIGGLRRLTSRISWRAILQGLKTIIWKGIPSDLEINSLNLTFTPTPGRLTRPGSRCVNLQPASF